MKKKPKRALTPKLRFPEFRREPGWGEEPLGKLSSIVRGGSPRPIDTFLTKKSNGLNWLKIGDVDREAKYITKTEEKVRPEALSKTRVVHPGDFILSNSMSFGRPYITEIKTCIHDGWIAVTDINDCINHEFLYHSIVSGKSQNYFIDQAAGSGVKNLNIDIVESLPILHPGNCEQQKIADCLSSLDLLIAAEGRRLDALKAYKKGLMQQLFPQPGETQPRLRFPEFRKAGKAKPTSLGEVVRFQSGGTPSKTNATFWNGSIPWVSAKSMKSVLLHDTEDHISEDAVKAGAKQVPAGTVLMLIRGMTLLKDVPICMVQRPMSFNQDVKALHTKAGLDSTYLIYLLLGHKQQLLSMVDIAGHGTGRLDTEHLRGLDINLPTIAEQQKIADCLTALDTRITAQTAKIESLKQHKRGLLQQLFPAPEEANGISSGSAVTI